MFKASYYSQVEEARAVDEGELGIALLDAEAHDV
jgi:hypothetical protein